MARHNDTILSQLAMNEYSQFRSLGAGIVSKTWNFLKQRLRYRYGYSIEVKDDYKITILNDYFKSIDSEFNKKSISDNGLLADTSVIYPVEENTFIYIIAGDPFSDRGMRLLLDYNRENSSASNNLKIFIYGKYAKKYLNIIKSKITKKSTSALKIFNISSNKNDDSKESFQSIISDMKARELDTLFYEDDIKESVIRHIDGFFSSKKLYEEKNINYKTSILLYGPPGTGKSSLANAICNKYGLDMVLVDMNTFDRLDVNILTQCINGDDKTYVVLLEDIDTVFNVNRESNETLEKDDKKVINKLLQFLDSNSSPNNVIFLATTNHIDKLDEAILRKGRIDKNVYIGPIKHEVAKQMCESFGITEKSINMIMDKYKNEELINQSTLQSDILECIKIETAEEAGIVDVDKALSDAAVASGEENTTVVVGTEKEEDEDDE